MEVDQNNFSISSHYRIVEKTNTIFETKQSNLTVRFLMTHYGEPLRQAFFHLKGDVSRFSINTTNLEFYLVIFANFYWRGNDYC